MNLIYICEKIQKNIYIYKYWGWGGVGSTAHTQPLGWGVHNADATLTDSPPYLLIYIIIDFISINCIFGQKIEVNI